MTPNQMPSGKPIEIPSGKLSQSSQPSQMPTPSPTPNPITPNPIYSPTITPNPTPTLADGPVARDDEVSISADGGLAFVLVLKNDTPAPGEELTVKSITSDGSNGLCAISLDSLVYVPNVGFVGTDSCVYEACDSVPECDTATLTIEVRDSLLD
eukprot:CAMPEP_0201889690 /NCGR_PEP_ID=MMETSP0902-20130614/30609_1 /ASSEMBLY_ACC=CAM_ASM_000551 /TAXON_ID=420261 /ORGANISM="Thalassiosira antarctica, Strain CCMP982" /LENGTH=153 /DNA_ID=CAMNT_0048420343 /DNA_START=364 /DNA_END=825 /DNA_ORIENTATION=+